MTGSASKGAVPLGRWILALVGVVLAVNILGVWEIASALRALRLHAETSLRLETAARARSLEALLASTAAELTFLLHSATRGLDGARRPSAGRDEIGGAMLLFFRGHPEVNGLLVRDAAGEPVVEAGRPRGVPGYWVPDRASRGQLSEAGGLHRAFDATAARPADAAAARLEARLDARALLEGRPFEESLTDVRCELRDAEGRLLAADAAGAARADAQAAEAAVQAEGWGVPQPLRLRCRPPEPAAASRLEPLVARHRTTIGLNVAVMGLASVLGMLAFHQSRRRYQFEARAREEARVRGLEQKLTHAERLSTVGRLAAGIAHEINNPLEGMANYLRLSSDAVERDDRAAARRYLGNVGQGLEHLAGVVRRVLDHAEPSTALDSVIDLAEVVRGAVEFVRLRDEFRAIRFAVELPPEALRVRGNAIMLSQVFLNLLLNACEAQPGGGDVLAGGRREGDHVLVEVVDRGPGVPEALRDRIFEPFESSKQSAGLGLFVCRSIVQQHRGELTVHAREGEGAVFRVRLPAAPQEDGRGRG